MDVRFSCLNLDQKVSALKIVADFQKTYEVGDMTVSFSDQRRDPERVKQDVLMSGPFEEKRLENYAAFGVALCNKLPGASLSFLDKGKEIYTPQIELALARKYKQEDDLKNKIVQVMQQHDMTVPRIHTRKTAPITSITVQT